MCGLKKVVAMTHFLTVFIMTITGRKTYYKKTIKTQAYCIQTAIYCQV